MIYDLNEVSKKIVENKIDFIISTKGFRNKKLWWIDINWDNEIYQFTKGTSKFDPVYVSIEYIPSKIHGSGAQLVTDIDPEKIENNFISFLNELKNINYYFPPIKSEIKKYKNFSHYLEGKTLNPFGIFYSKSFTYDDWLNSKKNFGEFSLDKRGYKVDDNIIDYMRDCVPPFMGQNYLALGEPVIDEKYYSFHKFDKQWYYSGLKTKKELLEYDEKIKIFEKILKDQDG